MKNLKNIVLLFVFLTISYRSFSQKDLREDKDFLFLKIEEYSEWLEVKGFNQVVIVDSFIVLEDKVSLFLGYSEDSKNDFSLNVAWQELKDKYENKSEVQLEETLFNSLFFTLEVSPDSVEIYILGNKAHLFSVEIIGSETGIFINDKIAAARDSEKIPIPIINLKTKYVEQKDKIKAADLNKITKEISRFLKKYYKEKGAWWYYAEIEIVKNFQHDLVIEITDLKGEVLRKEREYFEYIRISVKAEKQGKNIVLTYDLMAKYGSGIFLAPRSVSDYKNMEIHYSASLEKYKEKIKSLIHKNLTK